MVNMATDTHGSNNPYHYSFNLCAGGTYNAQSNRGEGSYRPNSQNNQKRESFYSSYMNSSFESEFHCDQCDRSFRNDTQLKKHISEHVTCGESGCKFTAHPKVIANHVRMQHATGIFSTLQKLDNPEEVKKWLAERKKKYPTKKNIDNQQKLEEAKQRRGEKIKPDNCRFNKNFSKRGGREQHPMAKGKRPRKRTHKNATATAAHPSLIESSCEVDGKLRDIPKFRGIGSINEKVAEETIPVLENADFHISDDEEPVVQPASAVTDSIQPANKSLALLMASYDSDCESDAEQVPPKSHLSATQPVVTCDDDGPPEEVKTAKACDTPEIQEPVEKTRKRKQPVDNGRSQKRHRNEPRNKPTPHAYTRPRKLTLLQKLLNNQVIHERNVILDCVHHAVENNFFDGEASQDEIIPTKIARKKLLKSLPVSSRSGKKQTLLQGLLKDEIIHERNFILQCVRHVVNANFFDPVKN